MKVYHIQRFQELPITIGEAWEFFSSSKNLQEITPEDMRMVILDDAKEQRGIYAGQIINYRLSPFPGIWMRWTTEITHCVPGEYFVDEQRFGPFGFWHHKHFIKATDNGVMMEDIVHYALPFGWIGRLAHRLVIKKRVEQVFEFRAETMKKLFG